MADQPDNTSADLEGNFSLGRLVSNILNLGIQDVQNDNAIPDVLFQLTGVRYVQATNLNDMGTNLNDRNELTPLGTSQSREQDGSTRPQSNPTHVSKLISAADCQHLTPIKGNPLLAAHHQSSVTFSDNHKQSSLLKEQSDHETDQSAKKYLSVDPNLTAREEEKII
jgi:hypothetical protein